MGYLQLESQHAGLQLEHDSVPGASYQTFDVVHPLKRLHLSRKVMASLCDRLVHPQNVFLDSMDRIALSTFSYSSLDGPTSARAPLRALK